MGCYNTTPLRKVSTSKLKNILKIILFKNFKLQTFKGICYSKHIIKNYVFNNKNNLCKCFDKFRK